MTKTALANKELKEKALDRESREMMHGKDIAEKKLQRLSNEKIARRANWAKIAGAGIGAVAKINDPEWYKRYMPELYRYTNLPTYERLGSSTYGNTIFNGMRRPGIMVFGYYNVVGTQDGYIHTKSPINQILMRSREMVLKLNSRSNVNWEAGDLGFNIFASGSIITALGEIKRVLEIFTTYRGDNAYLAKDLITSLGYDYDDIVTTIAGYRKRYTSLAKRFNEAIVAPRSLSYYDRKWFLATNVFTDHDLKAGLKQMYAFRSQNFLMLSDDGSSVRSASIWSNPSKDPHMPTTIGLAGPMYGGNYWLVPLGLALNYVEVAITKITENPDFVEMYADLRAAFGSDLFKVPEVIEESFTFNDNELNRIQIHNLRTLPVLWTTVHDGVRTPTNFKIPDRAALNSAGEGDIRQDSSGYIIQGSEMDYIDQSHTGPIYLADSIDETKATPTSIINTINMILNGENVLLDSPHDEIDGDEILDITRLVHQFKASYDTRIQLRPVCCGTEVVSQGLMFTVDNTGTLTAYIACTNRYYQVGFATAAIATDYCAGLTEHIDFDWAPLMFSSFYDSTLSLTCSVHSFEMYHAFPIDKTSLKALHEACLLSEFYLAASAFSGSGR